MQNNSTKPLSLGRMKLTYMQEYENSEFVSEFCNQVKKVIQVIDDMQTFLIKHG